MYGALLGAVIATIPFAFGTAWAALPVGRWLDGACLLGMCLSITALIALRTGSSAAPGPAPHGTSRQILVMLATGGTAVAIQCIVLGRQVAIWHSRSGYEVSGTSPHWYALGYVVLTCGTSFVGCGAIGAAFDRRVTADEHSHALEKFRLKVKATFGQQHIARWESALINDEIAKRRLAETRLARSANLDPLTGLMNRAYLLQMLGKTLDARANGDPRQTYLLHVDLDRFRSVNELLGNHFGDLLLKEIAARLHACTRDEDLVVRLSGDEFALLFAHIHDVDRARRMADRLLLAIEKPIELDGHSFPVTASIGVCEIVSRYSDTEAILRDADTAMHRAKSLGGNRHVLYDSAMYDEALEKVQTTLQIKAAADNDEFELYYQPLIDMRDCSIYGVEALIRWNHPRRGLLNAGEFIRHAEDAGYAVSLGRWTMRRACADLKTIRNRTGRDIVMSVNASAKHLEDQSFLPDLKAVVRDSGIDPHLLQLEIVESAFLSDANHVGQMFDGIRAMGAKIALDDFGTGYSSLSYLQRFPVDTLKIDQSFVRGIQSGSVNSFIVRFIIELAESTGMNILAEGVEEKEHVDILTASGCYLAQGYLYSRPVNLSALIDLFDKGIECPW